MSVPAVLSMDGWLSVEHEGVLMYAHEGLEKSVALLKGVMPTQTPDPGLQIAGHLTQ